MYNRNSYSFIVTSFITGTQHTPFMSEPVGCLDKKDSGFWQEGRGRSR